MLGLGRSKGPSQQLACLLSNTGFSLIGFTSPQDLTFYDTHYSTEHTSEIVRKNLTETVKKHNLYGLNCQVILAPNLYELLLLDALDVEEAEMAKALRWQLKGLISYPLKDIVIDTFSIPLHGGGNKRNKVFAAVTPQSSLTEHINLIEKCFLKVKSVSIGELAIGHLIKQMALAPDDACLVIGYSGKSCQFLFFYKEDLYFFRTITMNHSIVEFDNSANQNMAVEIQRSIDYCSRELKLPEPNHVFFTPSFYKAEGLASFLKTELEKDIRVLDLNTCFMNSRLPHEVMAKIFYAVGGMFMLLDNQRGPNAKY